MIYFYTEANMNVEVEGEDHANLPPLPINEMKVEKEDEKVDMMTTGTQS